MFRRVTCAAVGMLAAAISLSACSDSTNPHASSTSQAGSSGASSNGSSSGSIIIGAAVASSGFMTSFDKPDMEGFRIALNEINAAGGISGHKVKLITEDSASTPAGAKKAATDLIAKGAQILLVTANFDVGSPAGIAAQAKNILNVSIGAASPKYGVQGIGPQAYTIAPATYQEGATEAQFAKNEGWQHIFLLNDTSLDYSSEQCDGVSDQAKVLGLKTTEATFQNSDQSIASQISQIKSSGATAIALCSYTPGGATAMRQIRAAGVNLPTLAGIGMAGTYWLKAVPNLSNFYTASTASIFGDDPNPKVNAFITTFKKDYGALPATDAAVGGYSAGEMIFDALKATNGDTSGPALSAVLDKFHNEPLLAGPTTFTPTLHIPATRPLKMIKYTNGKPAYFKTVPVQGTVNLHLSS